MASPLARLNTTTLVRRPRTDWSGVLEAYLAEVGQRTGSLRTPQEYRRVLVRFLAGQLDPADVTAAHAHAFAYAPGGSGREPSPSTVILRLAAIRGLYDFARRMKVLPSSFQNPATGDQTAPPGRPSL